MPNETAAPTTDTLTPVDDAWVWTPDAGQDYHYQIEIPADKISLRVVKPVTPQEFARLVENVTTKSLWISRPMLERTWFAELSKRHLIDQKSWQEAAEAVKRGGSNGHSAKS